MRTVAEYVAKVAEFNARAERTSDPALKKRYADLAASYQIMAEERSRTGDVRALALRFRGRDEMIFLELRQRRRPPRRSGRRGRGGGRDT